MCGIAGHWELLPSSNEEKTILAAKMALAIRHRGPDDYGVWIDPETGVALSHRRLSIVDLSPLGHQPMVSQDSRYVLVFNGEIYNFQSLRSHLEHLGHIFNGHSDTEVMLACFQTWGVEESIKKLRGMFAFALWDRLEKSLYLSRDRLGEKPLYYGLIGGKTLAFASELKSFKVLEGWKENIDRNALALLMRYSCVPSPFTIYEGVYKLPPGTFVKISNPTDSLIPVEYWSAKNVAESGVRELFVGSEDEAIYELQSLLKDTISSQMISDVPLGAFLSGGIDSSLIVALMQEQRSTPVRTFSIGFNDAQYNEATYAKDVASYLGTDHTELYISSEQAISTVSKLHELYDEPFADSSQIATYLVSRLAKDHVSVALSGDAADELFGGYNRHLISQNTWGKINYIPLVYRNILSKILVSQSPQQWDKQFSFVSRFLPSSKAVRLPGEKIHKLANIITSKNIHEMYVKLISRWENPDDIVLGGKEPLMDILNPKSWPDLDDFTQEIMYLDLVNSLPNDVLVKVDRASMSVSLESRMPFLDHRIVEFAWTLPMSMKIRDGETKWILRQLLYKYVPKALVSRPKMGFGVPIDSWLRFELREWAEDLLSESVLDKDGFFDTNVVRQKWQEHLSGRYNWQHQLWNVLMFQSWFHGE
jgi:asparagine synthase (glutamine-hydrolysing)